MSIVRWVCRWIVRQARYTPGSIEFPTDTNTGIYKWPPDSGWSANGIIVTDGSD